MKQKSCKHPMSDQLWMNNLCFLTEAETSLAGAHVVQQDCWLHTFHSSSSLFICCAVIWRARSCSCSDGIFTSQDRKQRSWISGCHCELSQLMSFRLLWLAHGCLHGHKISRIIACTRNLIQYRKKTKKEHFVPVSLLSLCVKQLFNLIPEEFSRNIIKVV